MNRFRARWPGRVLPLSLVLMAVTATVFSQSDGPSVFVTNTPGPPAPLAATPYPQSLLSARAALDRASEARSAPNLDARVLVRLQGATSFPIISHYLIDRELWYGVLLPDGSPGWLLAQSVSPLATWRRVVETFDGVDMVLVPPGCFMMGSETGEADEQPVHPQCFDQPFWIDQYEVTNARYGSAGYLDGDSRPRESVDWFAAGEHCAARGARLPTEAEWEYAARGPSAWDYPWGNEFVNANAVSSWENTVRRTAPVGSRPGGASWVGALDMSGNVWEWTSTLYAEYPYDSDDGREDADDQINPRIVRGGSCCSYMIADVRATYRFPIDSHTEDPNVGFRCARDD